MATQVVPFFLKHPLKTQKRLDFEKFRRVLLLMERGEHLTVEGVERIRAIAAQMNRGRSRESPAPSETEGENPSEIPCRVSSDPHER